MSNLTLDEALYSISTIYDYLSKRCQDCIDDVLAYYNYSDWFEDDGWQVSDWSDRDFKSMYSGFQDLYFNSIGDDDCLKLIYEDLKQQYWDRKYKRFEEREAELEIEND